MSRLIIYPYKLGSESAKLLSDSLGTKRVRPDGAYRYRPDDIILNWGNSNLPTWYGIGQRWLNEPANVHIATNKLLCFRQLKDAGLPTPEFTTSREVASDWDEDGWEGQVYVRNKLTGHSGEGVEVFDSIMALPQAPLYTRGIENHGEYRVHIFNGQVIDYRKKRRVMGDTPSEAQNAIRTHENGWIYTMTHLKRLERVEALAQSTILALGLDFGAVDIIKDENGEVFVLEVNTAPGIEGSTLEAYVNALTIYAG